MAQKIQEVEKSLVDWNAEACNVVWTKLFDNFFYNNIIKRNHIKFPKEWHKNIKRISNY